MSIASISLTDSVEFESKSDEIVFQVTVKMVHSNSNRCCARVFNPIVHLDENKRLKGMRDDPANLYGDRCKFKKLDDIDFCTIHSKKQKNGIWGTDYSGPLKALIDNPDLPDLLAFKPNETSPKKISILEEQLDMEVKLRNDFSKIISKKDMEIQYLEAELQRQKDRKMEYFHWISKAKDKLNRQNAYIDYLISKCRQYKHNSYSDYLISKCRQHTYLFSL